MPARALMILGTASHAGKSLLTAALGRILVDESHRVAPFKAENMSLNSAATPDGRAQALQAEACRIRANAEMNPVLIQMLGRSIEDPHGVESNGAPRSDRGLGILPISTLLQPEKVTRQVHGRVLGFAACPTFEGYEIHMGETVYENGACPLAEIQHAGETVTRADGCIAAARPALGTYIHGLFHNDAFRHSFLAAARAACGLAPLEQKSCFAAEREARIDRLASHVRRALDMRLIHSLLGRF